MREFPERELTWTQPELLKGYFELRCGNDRIGTLRWEKSFGSLATAEASEGRWTFERWGFWRIHVTVSESGSAETIAMYESNWNGMTGSLQYRGGQRIQWASRGPKWTSLSGHSRWWWFSENGPEIAGFSSDNRLMKSEGRLEVSTRGALLPELPLLVLLGWYLLTPAGLAPFVVETERQTIRHL